VNTRLFGDARRAFEIDSIAIRIQEGHDPQGVRKPLAQSPELPLFVSAPLISELQPGVD
jgi:hypothetical protein